LNNSVEAKQRERAERLLARESVFKSRLTELSSSMLRLASWLKAGVQKLYRMMAAWYANRYQPSRTSLAITLAALAYFLSPIDILPDFIPVIGILDDLALFWLISMLLRKEFARFGEWEREIR
jgi:uncharacterized membrane protein YkvA (DUF1232 family)